LGQSNLIRVANDKDTFKVVDCNGTKRS